MKTNPAMKTIRKVKSTIFRHGMIDRDDCVVVAVSGGPDSVCLLHILYELRDELGASLLVAHFDHGLRPNEDPEETRFVKTMADSLGLPFYIEKADRSLQSGRGSLEEKARHARYCFLMNLREKRSAQKIATGHTLNDQAETILMRLLRGSGAPGLSGIPPIRDDVIIRPLIGIGREEVKSFLEWKGLEYLTDASNLKTGYVRNSIRWELLPILQKYQPRITEILGQTGEIMKMDGEWLDSAALEWFRTNAEPMDGGRVRISLFPFTKAPAALRNRVIRHTIKTIKGDLRGVNQRHIKAVNQLSKGDRPQASVNLPHGLRVRRAYDHMVFDLTAEKRLEGFSYVLDGPGVFNLDGLDSTILLEEAANDANQAMVESSWTASLDADHITYPLVIRNWKPGDRFVPLGMTGHKKIKDFFIDLKVPSEVRKRLPILVHMDRPIWICGFRIDARYKVSSKTKRILKATLTSAHP
jgi:tRNA(Ile)-lysidine synthase